MNRPSRQARQLLLGGGCELTCQGLCDCHGEPSDPRRIAQVLGEGGSRLTLRGGAATHPLLAEYARQARTNGFAKVSVRTNALAHATPGEAEELARRGVDSVVVPFFSQVSAVHDRVSGKNGSLVQALVGIRQLAAAGLALEIEVPILQPRLQDLTALVDLVHRAVPALAAVTFYIPCDPVPLAVAPPDWDEGAARLAAAHLLDGAGPGRSCPRAARRPTTPERASFKTRGGCRWMSRWSHWARSEKRWSHAPNAGNRSSSRRAGKPA